MIFQTQKVTQSLDQSVFKFIVSFLSLRNATIPWYFGGNNCDWLQLHLLNSIKIVP